MTRDFFTLIYVAGTVAVALYLYRVFLPYIREGFGGKVDPDKRAAELLRQYRERRKKDSDDASAEERRADDHNDDANEKRPDGESV